MNPITLESTNLNELAYQEIKKCIISRELAPGERLVDSQLAALFGISRTPIRDAMRRLTKEGLLTNTSARGFYVFTPTLRDIDEIFSISKMVETEAATRIIHFLMARPAAEWEEKLCLLGEKANDVSSISGDEEFKRYLIEISDNARLYDIYVQNHWQRVLLANIIHGTPDPAAAAFRMEKSKLVHNRIVLGIRNHDIEYTVKAIEEHNSYGITDAVEYVQQLDPQP